MKIRKQPTSVTITLEPKDYWLVKNDDNPNMTGEYKLIHRIDMSYAGKVDQEGADFMSINNFEAQTFRDAGFEELV